MSSILIHPTHRKFVKLLRNKAKSGIPVILTKKDIDAFKDVFSRTKETGERHRGIYRIALRAMNRNQSEFEKADVVSVIDHETIDGIKKFLILVERKNLGKTLLSTFIIYLLRILK